MALKQAGYTSLFGILAALMLCWVLLPESYMRLREEILIAVLLTIPMVVNVTLVAIHRSLGDFNWVNGVLLVSSAAYALNCLILFQYGISSAIVFFLISALLSVGMMVVHLYSLRGFLTPKSPELEGHTQRSYVNESFAFALPALGMLCFSMIDRFLLLSVADAPSAGQYAAAIAIVSPIGVLIESIVQVGFVQGAWTRLEQSQRTLLLTRIRFGFLGAISIVILLWFVIAPLTVLLFGDGFERAGSLASVMLVAAAIRGFGRTIEALIRGYGMIWAGFAAGLFGSIVMVISFVVSQSIWSQTEEPLLFRVGLSVVIGELVFAFVVLRIGALKFNIRLSELLYKSLRQR
jgi:O-antigen/teichoic acid export membrane protein